MLYEFVVTFHSLTEVYPVIKAELFWTRTIIHNLEREEKLLAKESH
jgi:hypothetical protein